MRTTLPSLAITRPARIGVGLALSAIVVWGLTARLGFDYDGDGSNDSSRIGGLAIHFFWTGDDTPDEARPIAANWDSVLREALSHNDFVFDFLHRDDPAEVAVVRAAARQIVGDAATDRQKVERLIDWLGVNWNFKEERSVVNAAALLQKRKGMCETSGFVVGALDTLGIKAREVNVAGPGPAPPIAVEVWLDGKWRVADVFGKGGIDRRSIVEMLPGRESEACIVYYWRDPKGKLLRSKLWYDARVATLFVTDHGLSAPVADLAQLRLSY
jgi:transglutaminase superfamily protein